MQAEHTVVSLRPGGGGGLRGTRFLTPRVDSSFSSDAHTLRPHGGLVLTLKTGELQFEGHDRVRYTRDQLLHLRELQPQSQGRSSEIDNRDWRGHSGQLPASGEERSWDAIRNRSNIVNLHRKTVSLLEEYFSVRILDEALQCVEELNAPAYHPEVVKEAISLALEKSPPCVEPVMKFFEYLLKKSVLIARDIGAGCLMYGSVLDDIGIDLPRAPNSFGEVLGQLVLAGALDFKVVREVLKKVEDASFQTAIFSAAMRSINSSPSGQNVVEMQGAEIQGCKSLLP